jgi:integrase
MRVVERLTDMEVKNAKPGRGKSIVRLPDGANLYLQVSRSKSGGFNRNWIFRFQLDGERDPKTGRVTGRHDLGLGPLHSLSLAEAREEARKLRQKILAGINPLEERIEAKAERRAKTQAARAERAMAVTFRECFEAYYKIHSKKWRNEKHRAQWRSTIEEYANPVIGDLNVADVETSHVQKILTPIWDEKSETASRLLNRMGRVFDFAIASKFRSKENPVQPHQLKTLLGVPRKDIEHHAAMRFLEAPAFMGELRQRNSLSASALEFLILTAARTGEVIGARWSEIDIKGKVWTVPGARMKAGVEHRVPLNDRAIEILRKQAKQRRSDFVFGSAVTGKPLSNMAMLELLRGMQPGHTVHGFRSAFRDWAAETTAFPNHVVEKALAHTIGDKVEKAYRRGDLFEKRRKLMEQWQRFLAKPPVEGGKVVPIRRVS